MARRVVQLVTDNRHAKVLSKIHRRFHIEELSHVEGADGKLRSSFLVDTGQSQALLDVLRPLVDDSPETRVVMLPVEAVLPRDFGGGSDREPLAARGRLSKEELRQDINASAQLDGNFVWMVLLSTIVAAIGLIENNEAVLVGAMVIAPFLGPNLALAFAAATGDIPLLKRSLILNLSGFALVLVMSITVGALWSGPLDVPEIIARTDVGFSGVLLALASGAAAVVAMTSGSASTLVGVMVAVALLPPATTLGMMLGRQLWPEAGGAALLLLTNIVCVNLAANLCFMVKGVAPRRDEERKKAAKPFLVHRLVVLVLLFAVCLLIWLRL